MNKPKIKLINKNLVPYLVKASEISYATYKVIRKPNAGSIAGLVSVLGKTSIDAFAPDIFDDWYYQPFPQSMAKFVYNVIKRDGKFIKRIYQREVEHQLYDFMDIYVSFNINNTATEGINSVLIHKDDVEDLRQKFAAYMWRDKHLLMDVSDLTETWTHSVSFLKDDLYSPLPTRLGAQIYDDCKKYYAFNKQRTLMFLGRPGTGKSSMAKYISTRLGMRTLRILGGALAALRAYDIMALVKYMEPEVVIIEEMDKVHLDSSVLEFFQSIKKDVKFMFLTINKKENLEDSLLRAGRVDDYIIVENMEEEIILNILGEENKELLPRVIEWPVAYIDELKTRIQVIGKERAVESIEALNKRVEELRTKDEDEDEDEDEDDDDNVNVTAFKKYKVCKNTRKSKSFPIFKMGKLKL